MAIITPERIADLIEEAPAWALLGLTMPKESLRDAARLELANHVYTALYRSDPAVRMQLPLPL